jgi:hypothetical protein
LGAKALGLLVWLSHLTVIGVCDATDGTSVVRSVFVVLRKRDWPLVILDDELEGLILEPVGNAFWFAAVVEAAVDPDASVRGLRMGGLEIRGVDAEAEELVVVIVALFVCTSGILTLEEDVATVFVAGFIFFTGEDFLTSDEAARTSAVFGGIAEAAHFVSLLTFRIENTDLL